MKRRTQFDLLEEQKKAGSVSIRTMFLAMEEELRNEADVLRGSSIIRDAKMRDQIAGTLEHAANFCGMHSFSHVSDFQDYDAAQERSEEVRA